MAKKKSGQNLPAISTKLTLQQQMAAQVLAFNGYIRGAKVRNGATRHAAEEAGVSQQAIYIWLDIPEFVEEIEKERRRANFVAWRGLMALAGKGSLGAMREILDRANPDENFQLMLRKIDHEHAKELLQLRARLGIEEEEEVLYRVHIGEYGEDVENPETQH